MPPRERPAVVIYGHLDHCTVDPIEIRLRTDTTIHIEKLILAQLFGQLFGAKLATHVVASVESGVAVAKVYSPAVLIRSITHT